MYVFLTVTFLTLAKWTQGNDYFTSPAAVEKLFKVEQQLVSAFSAYATLLEKRMKKVEEYLEDYEQSILTGRIQNQNEISKLSEMKDLDKLSTAVASHPLMTHRLIRRFVVQLQELERDLGNQAEKQMLNAMEKIRKGIRFPQARDVTGSIEGLLRVQDAYDLNITDFTQGSFQGVETKSSLTASDCYQVGLYALEAQIHTRAIEWLERAYTLTTQEGDTTKEANQVLRDLELAISQHDKVQIEEPTNIYVYRQPIGNAQKLLTRSTPRLEKTADLRQYLLYNDQENIHDLYNFAALCSGKVLQAESARKSLKCFHHPTPGIPILIEKVEILHQNPEVVQVHNILSTATIKSILDLANPSMTRSKVQGAIWEEEHSNTRTSTTAWIQEGYHDNLLTLSRRIQRFTGLDVFRPIGAEDLQVSSYGIGGHYNPHLDLLFEEYVIPSPEERLKGDRIATFLFYLSDVAKGGGTAFPRLGILAQPIKGSGIFWYNLKLDGSTDPLSLHGGCPVLYGTKHVANKWIRANAQFQTRKCLRKPEKS